MNMANREDLQSNLQSVFLLVKNENDKQKSLANPNFIAKRFIYSEIDSATKLVNESFDKWVKDISPSVDRRRANSTIQEFNTKIQVFINSGWDHIQNTSKRDQVYEIIHKLNGFITASSNSQEKPKTYNEWQTLPDFYDIPLTGGCSRFL